MVTPTLESCVGLSRAGCEYPHLRSENPHDHLWGTGTGFELGARRARDKKLFVRVTECWHNACESDISKKLNATENLCYNYKCAATFSSGGETTDWSFQLSVILQEIRSAWWQLALLMNECLVWLGMSWIEEHI